MPIAMIFPYPNTSGEEPIIIETLPSDSSIFKSMNECFEGIPISTDRIVKSTKLNTLFNVATNYLSVKKCGIYKYSIAHNLKELSKLNPIIFKINSNLSKLIGEYEMRNFGFIVCIIDQNAEYAPFAYLTAIENNTFFIPTKHYHEQPLPCYTIPYSIKKSNIINTDTINDDIESNIIDGWDHEIYVLHAKDGNANRKFSPSNTKYCTFSFYLKPCTTNNMIKRQICGTYENKDIEMVIA